MCQNCSNQAQNCVEFRESGVDEGVGDNVVTLGDAYDTVGAYLTLTDAGDHAGETCGEAHTEADPSVDGSAGEFTHHNQECHEAVDTLG